MTEKEKLRHSLKVTGQLQKAAVRMGNDFLTSVSCKGGAKFRVFMEEAGRKEGCNEEPTSKDVMAGRE